MLQAQILYNKHTILKHEDIISPNYYLIPTVLPSACRMNNEETKPHSLNHTRKAFLKYFHYIAQTSGGNTIKNAVSNVKEEKVYIL